MKGFLYGQTEYNILASSARLDLYIKKAKEYNFDFLSITDSTLHGVYKFYKACKQEGIKLTFPRMIYCTDNAAMIAVAGYFKYLLENK